MTFEQTVLLSAIAGLTIYLGLPVGRLRNLSTRTQAILTTAAAGVILFLIWDILAQAVEPVEASLTAATSGEGPTSDFFVNVTAFGASIAVGLLSLVWLTGTMRARRHRGRLRARHRARHGHRPRAAQLLRGPRDRPVGRDRVRRRSR